MKSTTRMSSAITKLSAPGKRTEIEKAQKIENEDTSLPGGLSMFSAAQEAIADLEQK